MDALLASAAFSDSQSRSRSISEYGKRWRRPYPPTATTAAPCGGSSGICSARRSTAADRSARAVTASPVARKSEGRVSTIIVTNPDRFGYFVDEDFAVADFTGARGGGEGADHLVLAG